MHFAIRKPFILLIGFIALGPSSYAFDPISALTVASTAVSVISQVTDAASEVGGIADSFTELYSEIDPDAEASEESRRVVEQLRDIESLAQEVGYSAEEINDLVRTDKSQLQSLAITMRNVTKAVRAGKRVAKLFSKLEKKAQLAQVESTSIQREQLRVQSRLLNEQIQAHLQAKKEKLLSDKEKKDQIKLYQKEIEKRGGKAFGRTGIYSFPKMDHVIEKALAIATKMRPIFIGLVLLALFIRLLFYQVSFSGTPKYGDLIRDVVVCLFLMAVFPELVHGIIGISQAISEKVAGPHLQNLQNIPDAPQLSIRDLSKSVSLLLLWLGSLLKYFAFTIADFIFNFGIAFLVLLFPLIIFASQMLNFSIAWPAFLASFITLSLWPLFWNSAGILAIELWKMDAASISDNLKTVFFSLLQLISPFVTMAVLKGQTVGAALKNTLTGAPEAISAVAQTGQGAIQGLRGAPGGNAVGRTLGTTAKTLGYPVSQVASRTTAAASRVKAHYSSHPTGREPYEGKWEPKGIGTAAKEGLKGFVYNEPAHSKAKTASRPFKSSGRFMKSSKNNTQRSK